MRCDAVLRDTAVSDAALPPKERAHENVTGPTAPRSIGKCRWGIGTIARIHANTFPRAQRLEGSSRAVRGALRGSPAERSSAACLWLAASHSIRGLSSRYRHGHVQPLGQHGPGLAAGSERALGEFPAVRSGPARLAGVDSLAGLGRRQTRDLRLKIMSFFPWPCHPDLWENQIHFFVSRARIKGSWRVQPPSKQFQRSIHTPTHPSIPKFLRCPGRPMTQCHSSLGRPAHG